MRPALTTVRRANALLAGATLLLLNRDSISIDAGRGMVAEARGILDELTAQLEQAVQR